MTQSLADKPPLDEAADPEGPGASLGRARIAAATAYFRRIDAVDPSVFDLFTDDVQIYFPKFGTARGKAALGELATGLMHALQSLAHDIDRMRFHAAGDHVIVEGFERGVTADGTSWPVPGLSEGQFCNVFEFEGALIKRLHIYVDPDFTSAHRAGFLWGDPIRTRRD